MYIKLKPSLYIDKLCPKFAQFFAKSISIKTNVDLHLLLIIFVTPSMYTKLFVSLQKAFKHGV